MAVPRNEKACKVGWNGLIGSAFSKNKLNKFEGGRGEIAVEYIYLDFVDDDVR